MQSLLRVAPLALAALCCAPALAQAPLAPAQVVVTATREERPSFDLPMAIDSVGKAQIQEQRLQVSVSEVLSRVPGVVVQNRETYSQEQQVVIRGFGARSQFGVRGIKLLADGIPASTPDGQGGTGLFDLSTAARIEVLRGPFSALYGNHSGGVVQVFTENGPARPTIAPSFAAGSDETWRAGLKLGGQAGPLNYTGGVSRFETDGYREWSSARREQLNAKLSYRPTETSSVTAVVNALHQPENLDPLGLTAAQMAQDRRQASPAARPARARRSLDNLQAGLVWDNAMEDGDSLRMLAYAGRRGNEQYQAIPLPVQTATLTHPGAVSIFDRDFGGLGVRWSHRAGDLLLTTGADYERAVEARKGYLNRSGEKGELRRDEDNTVWQAGTYLQGEWVFSPRWSLSAGLRYTRVRFESEDRFVLPGNPDDSGSVTHDAWTPALGLLHRLSPRVNLYANAGRSFETPTFIELAYRPDGASGLNFALQPSRSRHYELGVKAFVTDDLRLNAALFHIDTANEIVTATSAGGRSSFRNAGDTRRRGVEIGLDGEIGRGLALNAALTWLDAEFRDAFPTSAGARVDAGNRVPGVPAHSAYAELSWRHPVLGLAMGIEVRWSGKVYATDVNDAAAEDYAVVNLRAGLEQQGGGWRFAEFARIDNLGGEKYVGAVYVNDANQRYYSPAPERSYLIGASASYSF